MEKFYSLKTLLKLAGGGAFRTSPPPGSATALWYDPTNVLSYFF